jgi:membrane protease subunit (stomatin/prohibitin family)
MAARVPPGGDSAIEWGSSLTVRESQKAVFLRDGKAMCVFDPGRYTLTTQNVPVLTKFLTGLVYGSGNTPFLADVYFISTGLFKDLKWGTGGGGDGSGINFRDPEFKYMQLRAYGSCSIQVKDPVVFLATQVKTAPVYRVGDLQSYVRDLIVPAMTTTLAELKVSIVDLPAHTRAIAIGVKALLADEMATSGLEFVDMMIGAITPPKEMQDLINKVSAARATKLQMDEVGDMAKFQQYQMGNAIPDMAKQPGGMGGGLNMGAQLGMAMMVPQMMANAYSNVGKPATPTPGVNIVEEQKPDPFAKIKQLKGLLDAGAITQEEFDKKKEELLKQI